MGVFVASAMGASHLGRDLAYPSAARRQEATGLGSIPGRTIVPRERVSPMAHSRHSAFAKNVRCLSYGEPTRTFISGSTQ